MWRGDRIGADSARVVIATTSSRQSGGISSKCSRQDAPRHLTAGQHEIVVSVVCDDAKRGYSLFSITLAPWPLAARCREVGLFGRWRSNAQSKLFLNIFLEFAFSRTFES